jgi:hypothetical protein
MGIGNREWKACRRAWKTARNGPLTGNLQQTKEICVDQRENFLYLIRCGMTESIPNRRILSCS